MVWHPIKPHSWCIMFADAYQNLSFNWAEMIQEAYNMIHIDLDMVNMTFQKYMFWYNEDDEDNDDDDDDNDNVIDVNVSYFYMDFI